MKRSRFTEEQIIGVLEEHQAGVSAADICRRHGISEATFYTWRSKYGGLEVSEARRLKALEEENAKLKKLLAESMLDVSTLREMLAKTHNARCMEGRGDLGGAGQGSACEARGMAAEGIEERATRGDGPASSWGSSRRLAATGRGDRMTGRFESVCGHWPWSGGGSAIGDCTFRCAVRGCGQTIRRCFGFIARNGSACVSEAAGSGLSGHVRQWLYRRDRTSAGLWISYQTRSATGDDSGFWRWSTILRGNAWGSL
jgi:putative transposase